MDKFFQYPAPWEVYAEERKRRYLEGMRLLRAYGRIDLVDEFALDGLTDEGVDLEAYIFALEHERAKEQRVNEAAPPLAAVARPTPAPLPPPNAPMPSRPADEVVFVPPGLTATAPSSDELIETALRRFLKAKRLVTQASTADKYGQQCRLFFKVVADGDPSKLQMSAITPQALRRYADILPLPFPPRCGRAIPGRLLKFSHLCESH